MYEMLSICCFLNLKVRLTNNEDEDIITLLDLKGDTDGLENFCIELGEEQYVDVSLVFEYRKGSYWNKNKYHGREEAIIDNIGLTDGECEGI